MYAQLGEIIFQKTTAFSSFSGTVAARIAEHQLIDGKSRLQKTGDELETIALEIYLHRMFADPQALYDRLKAYVTAGTILPFVDGDGLVYGDFLLTGIERTVSQLSPTGGLLALTLSLSLKEYVDPDPVATKATEARKRAIAIEENGVVPVRNTALVPTPLGFTVSQVTTTRSASLAANANVAQAALQPSQSESLFNRAKLKLDQVTDATTAAIAKIQEANSLAQKAPDLLEALETVRTNANAMKTYCENGDLTNALTQGQALTDSVGAMDDAALPLTFDAIMRRP